MKKLFWINPLIFALIIFLAIDCKKDEPATKPLLSTSSISEITTTTASSGGNISSDGGASITFCGVCWSATDNPTTSDSKTSDGDNIGQYVSNIIGLKASSIYHVRAYATNSVGTAYGADISFTTLGELPSSITLPATEISLNSATLNGIINPNSLSTLITFEYGTTISYGNEVTAIQSPLTGSDIVNVNAHLTDLTVETTYHFRVKAVNTSGTVYGGDMLFTTSLFNTNEQAYPGVKGEIVQFVIKDDTIKCEKINDEYIYQGDIVLTKDQVTGSNIAKGAGIPFLTFKWPNNTIYYEINDELQNQYRIADAIKYWEDNTPLIFIKRTNQLNHIEFIWSEGCSSNIGMVPLFGQKIKIADWGTTGSVIHEIGHAVGLIHEQSRSDRDNYVKILWENIQDDEDYNFEDMNCKYMTPTFDFNSVMLYDSYAWTKNGLPTMTKIDGSRFSTQRVELSQGDIEAVKLIYSNVTDLSIPTVATYAPKDFTKTSAIIGGLVISDGGAIISETGVLWGNSPDLQNTGTKLKIGSTSVSFSTQLSSLTPGIIYYVVAYATNSVGTGFGSPIKFNTTPDPGFNPNITYGSVTDLDGNVYRTVKIGSQVWMAENLNIGKVINCSFNQTNNNLIEKHCFYSDDDYADLYGGIYQWNEMMNYSIGEKSQGICPIGWHIPDKADWQILLDKIQFDGFNGLEGKVLKSLNGWESGNGVDNYGFAVLPSGYRNTDGGFYEKSARFWSSTPYWNVYFEWWQESLSWYNLYDFNADAMNGGATVRCVKDN